MVGISEEIRNKIVIYRSKKEEKNSDDFYPRIEKISDNIGNVWTADNRSNRVQTSCKLTVGDKLIFIVSATDPLGAVIEYKLRKFAGGIFKDWTTENEIELLITEEHIRKNISFQIQIRSPRKYKAHGNYDDSVQFYYEVIPPI